VEERRAVHRILVGKRKDCHHLEDLGVDVRITLRLILKEQDGKSYVYWTVHHCDS